MSLVGFVPPFPDVEQDCVFVDGGYCKNLPVEEMRALGGRVMICVNVSAEDEPLDLKRFADSNP